MARPWAKNLREILISTDLALTLIIHEGSKELKYGTGDFF